MAHPRTLHLVSGLHSGGVERWLYGLAKVSDEFRSSCVIATLDGELGTFGRLIADLGVPIVPLNAATVFAGLPGWRRALRSHGPFTAVHSHLTLSGALPLLIARAAGIRARVAESHNVNYRIPNVSARRRLAMSAARFLMRFSATALISPSRESLEDMTDAHPSLIGRSRVIPCGVDFAKLPAAGELVDPLRESFGIAPTTRVLATIGRLAWEKRQEKAIETLACAVGEGADVVLVCIGDGPRRDELVSIANQLGVGDKLVMAGLRTDVPAALAYSIDLLLHPSPPPPLGNEAQPLAVLEAQAAGVPVVASDGVYEAAIIVPELVRRARYDDSPATWWQQAKSALAFKEQAAAPGIIEQRLQRASEAGYDLQVNASQILALYEG